MNNKSKIRSTTLWLTISIVVLNPIAWFLQYFFNRWNMQYLIQHGVKVEELQQYTQLLTFDIPLQPLATALVTAIGMYVGGQKGKSISTNLGKPKGEGTGERRDV